MPRPRATRPPITKRVVDAATPRDRRYLIFDGLVHGFALKVETSGSKVWVVQKSQAGRSVRVTLGAYPDLTVDQARRDAQAEVAKLARGQDPNAEKRAAIEVRRRAERDAVTVSALWDRYRVEEVVPAQQGLHLGDEGADVAALGQACDRQRAGQGGHRAGAVRDRPRCLEAAALLIRQAALCALCVD